MQVNWNAHLRTDAYFYQTQEIGASAEDQLPIYQHFDAAIGGLIGGAVSLRVGGRYAGDPSTDIEFDQNDRLTIAYAGIDLDPLDSKLRLGRQFLQEGSNQLVLDGLWMQWHPARRWKLNLWGGSRAPWARGFEFADPSGEEIYGGRVLATLSPRVKASLWASSSNHDGETVARPFGADLSLRPSRQVRALVRGSYDLESESIQRVDVLSTLSPWVSGPALRVQFVDRRPQVAPGSYFTRFLENVHRVRLLRGTAKHMFDPKFGLEAEAFSSFVDEHRSSRVGLAVIVPHARLGYSVRMGDSGEESRWYGDASFEPRHGLVVSAGLLFAEYALVEDAQSASQRDLTTAFVSADIEVVDGLTLLIEYEALKNPYYNEDQRLLLGIDLWASRGASRMGWGSGGER